MVTKNTKTLLLLGVLALLAVTPLKIVSLLGVLFILTAFFPKKTDFFYKIALSYVIFFSTNALLGGLAFLANLPINLSSVLLIYIGSFILLVCLGKLTLNFSAPNKKIALTFFIKMLMLLGILYVISSPVLTSDQASVAKAYTFGGDNISHVELFKAVESNQGYFYKDFNTSAEKFTEGLSGYPQGLHLNMYLVADGIKPFNSSFSNVEILMFNYLYFSLLYMAFFLLFLLVTTSVYKNHRHESFIIALLFAGVLFTGLFYALFILGSHAQIASMLLLLAMLYFIGRADTSENQRDRKIYSCLAITAFSGIPFTWLLLLPASSLILAYGIGKHYLVPVLRRPLRNRLLIVASLLAIMGALIQLYVQLEFSNPRNVSVNENGQSITPSIYYISLLILISLLALLLRSRRSMQLWLVALMIASVTSFSIYFYQLHYVGEARYYFYKSTYMIVLIGCIIIASTLASCAADLLSKSDPFKRRAAIYVVLPIMVITGTLYNLTNPKDYFVLKDGGGFSSELSATGLRLIKENPANGRKIIAVGSCNRAQDHTLNRLVSALTQSNNSTRQGMTSVILDPSRKSLPQAIKTYQSIENIDVIIVSSDYPTQQYLQSQLDNDRYNESFIDLDFGHKLKAPNQCPELVR